MLYQPADHRERIAKEIARYRKNQAMPTVASLMGKYALVEAEAKRLLASIKRKIATEEKATSLVNGRRIPNTTEKIEPSTESFIEDTAENAPHLRQILQDIRAKYGDEMRVHGEQTAIPEGFIYLVTHILFDGWVKAGMTIDFEQRLAAYNTSDPLSRFAFSRIKWVSNRRQAECDLLAKLALIAAEYRGEWFLIDHSAAVEIFNKQQSQTKKLNSRDSDFRES